LVKEQVMNKPRAKRILGMTQPQWLVLGVLLLCLCVTMVGGYYWLNGMVASAYQGPQGILPNFTPPPTHTPLPTATLVPTATITPITYESLIPTGWKKFVSESASNIEIWVPETYQRRTEKEDEKSIPILGSGEISPDNKLLMRLKDTAPSPYMIITTFSMFVQPDPGGDLDAIIDQKFSETMRTGRILERGKFVFKIRDYTARRLVFDVNVGTVNGGLALYVVRSAGNLYYLGYATIFNELYVRLPAFDDSIQTFYIAPIPPTATPTLAPVIPTNTSLP
jgi:hypothetical protein